MGELHLEIIVDRMMREFKVEATVGKPQVAYRETITKAVNAEGRYVRQSGGKGQFGHCKITVEPAEPGAGYSFESAIVGGAIPKEYIPVSYTHLDVYKRQDGKPVVSPTQDMVIGSYYLTIIKPGAKGEGSTFASPDECLLAYNTGNIAMQALVNVRVSREVNGEMKTGIIKTTAGRIIFNPVSYTHLDVYKRQIISRIPPNTMWRSARNGM